MATGPSYTFCQSPQLSRAAQAFIGQQSGQARCGHRAADRDRAGGSQTEDTEGELTTEVTTEVSSQTRHLVIRQCEDQYFGQWVEAFIVK